MTQSVEHSPPVTKRELASWMLFDFANSSYTTLIVTIAYSMYFAETVVGDRYGKLLWGVACFVSEFFVVLTGPVVGAVADFSGRKKRFLALSFVGCVAGTGLLGLVGPGDIALGMGLFIVSNILYSSGENLIAAFLPELTTPERMGRLSGYGWAVGYAGGLVSLATCFPFINKYIEQDDIGSMRISFVVVAMFFLLGGLPTFLFLRERATPQRLDPGDNYITIGIRRVRQTISRIRHYRQLFRFLLVFSIYNCGVATVIKFAGIYAKGEIKMDGKQFLIFFLVVQVSAAIGAFGFGFLHDRVGARISIILCLAIWLVVCVGAYLTSTAPVFYVIGNLAGIAMGAAQSGARALVGTFAPAKRTGEFFGFWGLAWKLSSGVGPLVFGSIDFYLGIRKAILITGIFFAVGIVGMFFVDEKAGRRAAERAEVLI